MKRSLNTLLLISFIGLVGTTTSHGKDAWKAYRKKEQKEKCSYKRAALVKAINKAKPISIIPGTKTFKFAYKNLDGKSGFEVVVRFKIIKVPEKLVSGDGTLFGCVLGSKNTYISTYVQACYLQGGSWYLNGLYLRENGKRSKFEKILKQVGPAKLRYGYKIDTQWHELSFICRKAYFEIKWDGNKIFEAIGENIDFNYFRLTTSKLQKKFKQLDLEYIRVYKLEPIVDEK